MSTPNAAGAAGTEHAGAAAAGAAGAAPTSTPGAAAAAPQGDPAAGAAGAAATPKAEGQAGAGAGTATATTSKTPEQTAADAAAAQAAAAPQGAPDKYALKVPEGGQLDQADVTAFEAIARARNLTNEQAQAVVNDQAALYKAQSESFLPRLKAHPEIGGANLEVAQLHANKFLDSVLPAATPEGQSLRSLLTKTGFANHPDVVLLLARAGKAMAEDTPIGLGGPRGGAARRSDADVLFG